MDEPLFSLDNVSFRYDGGIEALNGVCLALARGERAAFIGANGTGKSTLLTIMDALNFTSRGTMKFDGTAITARAMNDAAYQKRFRQRVGFVFQNPDVQLFCPTVREDILFGPLQLGLPANQWEKRFDKIVARLKLGPLLDRAPHRLSIGEKKKAAIATVLIIDPEVLLLDEPTAGLDPQTTRDIIAVLCEAHGFGKTIVMATHDLHIVEEIADTVHVFGSNHTIIRSGPVEHVLADENFLQENNLVHVHVHRHAHASHVHVH